MTCLIKDDPIVRLRVSPDKCSLCGHTGYDCCCECGKCNTVQKWYEVEYSDGAIDFAPTCQLGAEHPLLKRHLAKPETKWHEWTDDAVAAAGTCARSRKPY